MALANMSFEENSFEEILHAAVKLTPMIKLHRGEIERERRLPLELVEALKRAGVFRMTMPKDLGGAELDPINQLRIIEVLSEANTSVGWCVMIGSDNGYFSSFLEQNVAREMYDDVDGITGSALSQTGKAVKVDGGYRVSGRWPFASGCQHSTWLIGGCRVYDGDIPQLRPGGIPETRQCFLPAEAVTILDTWNTLGLRGSGSHDFTIQDYFVPDGRTFSFQSLSVYHPGALYQFPMAFMFNFAAVPVGTAKAAITALTEAGEKPSRQVTMDGKFVPVRTLREEDFVQDAVGRASALVGAARAYLFSVVGDLWETIQAGQPFSSKQMADFQTMNAQIFAMCLEAVELLFKARGGSSVYTGSILEGCLRDLLTMDQHVMNSLRSYGQSGRLLLGLPPEEILL